MARAGGVRMLLTRTFATTAVFVAPLVEEIVKGLAVLIVFWILHDEFDNVAERPGMGIFQTPLHAPGKFLYTALEYTLKVPGMKLFGVEALIGVLIVLLLVRGPLRSEARCARPAKGLVTFCMIAGITVLTWEGIGLARGGHLRDDHVADVGGAAEPEAGGGDADAPREAERAYELVCGAGGLALCPHTYGPRTMGM